MNAIDEPGLGSEARAVLEAVERFARDEVRPVGVQLDSWPDPADVIADGSPLWSLHDTYRGLGLDEITGSDAFSPVERSLLGARVQEVLGGADAGLAVSLAVSNFHRVFVALTGDAALAERYLADGAREIGCWAVTEPNHGSDSLAFTEPGWTRPEIRPDCIARRDGDDWVITGNKAAWVSNGTIATVAALFCTIDGDEGFSGGGVCAVPLDLPGVSRGRPLDKLGQRALPQGELHFDGVRVPGANMVVGKEAYSATVEMVLALANSYMGSTFSGLVCRAYVLALAYAGDRVRGGPDHPGTQRSLRLFKMFTRVEAATSLSRRVHLLGGARSGGACHRRQDLRHHHRLRGRQRGAPDLRGQRPHPGVPRGEDPPGCVGRHDRRRLQRDVEHRGWGPVGAPGPGGRPMRMQAIVAGVGMTSFGRHLDRGLKSLGGEAVQAALDDAGIGPDALDAADVGNAAAGLVTGQESIRGQVVLRGMGVGGLPVINVENACAVGFHRRPPGRGHGLSARPYDCVLALGVEKLYHEDKKRTFAAFSGAVDVEVLAELMAALQDSATATGAASASSGAGEKRSMFMDIYAAVALDQWRATAPRSSSSRWCRPRPRTATTTREPSSAKSSTVEDVLAAPMVAEAPDPTDVFAHRRRGRGDGPGQRARAASWA